MSRKDPCQRDQEATPFASILSALCNGSGAQCAALVDGEGETVDYGGVGDPFDIRILAAELRLLQQYLLDAPHLCDSYQFVVRARQKSFLLQNLPEGYALAVQLPRRASGISHRALSAAILCICDEAGFELPDVDGPTWRSIDVQEEGRGSFRPSQICVDGIDESLVVLGRIAGDAIARRERGFRVRLENGRESTLIREALGHWFLEED